MNYGECHIRPWGPCEGELKVLKIVVVQSERCEMGTEPPMCIKPEEKWKGRARATSPLISTG